MDDIALRTKMGNVERFDYIIGVASFRGAQIIVFSEGALGIGAYHHDEGGVASGALAEYIPDVSKHAGPPIIPCDDDQLRKTSPALVGLSCSARRHRITVVTDMGDLVPCRPHNPFNASWQCATCPSEGSFRFNTQIALGDRGELLAKYHKMHPYYPSEHAQCIGDGHQQPGLSDPVTFRTSFGVTFGMAICYDICFHTPAQQLALDRGLSDVVFSTHWENEAGPPMALSVPFFQSWSRGTGANLLAANAGMGFSHTGSAIFSRGVTLASTWQPDLAHDEVLLLARVPRLQAPTPNRVDGVEVPWATSTPFSRAAPVWELVNVTRGETRTRHVLTAAGGFTCSFTYSTSRWPDRDRAQSRARTTTVQVALAAAPVAPSLSSTTIAPRPANETADAHAEGGAARSHVTNVTNVTTREDEMEVHVLMAVNGSWFVGSLPARACVMYRVPRSSLPNGGAGGASAAMRAGWLPWSVANPVNGSGDATYRIWPASAPSDLRGIVVFDSLQVTGAFEAGDVVRPMVAASYGDALAADRLELIEGGRGLLVDPLEQPLTQAMLYVNTHPPRPIFTDTAGVIGEGGAGIGSAGENRTSGHVAGADGELTPRLPSTDLQPESH